MTKENGTICVIPARGGSKGVSRKCLREIGGTPILRRAIETACSACSVDRVVVSTDDAIFAEKAVQWGAEVPFLRPEELSGDNSSVVDAVTHLVDNIDLGSIRHLLLLQPTSPFTTSEDVDGAFSCLTEDFDAITSVCVSEVNPDWLRRVSPEGWIQPVVPLDVPLHAFRQSMPVTYRLNGALYWCRLDIFRGEKVFLPKRTGIYVMPQERSLDIDTELDLKIANFLASSQL